MLEVDPSVMLLGEDVCDPYGGAFKVTKGLSTRYPGRVLNTPISEAGVVGLGVGMALRGMAPVVEIMFGDFVMLAADQLVNHAAKYAAMYGLGTGLRLVVRAPMGAGRGYGPTHSQSLEKHFLGVPHLLVVAPSAFHDPGDLIKRSSQTGKTVLFIEHKLLYPAPLQGPGDLGDGLECSWALEAAWPIATLRNYDIGPPDVVIVGYGGISRHLTSFLAAMREEEVSVQAVLPSLISSIPDDVSDAMALAKFGCVVVEEGASGFGWTSEVLSQAYEKGIRVPVVRLASAPGVIPSARHLEADAIVGPAQLSAAVASLLRRSIAPAPRR